MSNALKLSHASMKSEILVNIINLRFLSEQKAEHYENKINKAKASRP
jgi:hypothetical protein